jgi:hypothetical protein
MNPRFMNPVFEARSKPAPPPKKSNRMRDRLPLLKSADKFTNRSNTTYVNIKPQSYTVYLFPLQYRRGYIWPPRFFTVDRSVLMPTAQSWDAKRFRLIGVLPIIIFNAFA